MGTLIETATAKPVIQQLQKSIKAALSQNATLLVMHQNNLTEEGYQDAKELITKLEEVQTKIEQLYRHEGMQIKKL